MAPKITKKAEKDYRNFLNFLRNTPQGARRLEEEEDEEDKLSSSLRTPATRIQGTGADLLARVQQGQQQNALDWRDPNATLSSKIRGIDYSRPMRPQTSIPGRAQDPFTALKEARYDPFLQRKASETIAKERKQPGSASNAEIINAKHMNDKEYWKERRKDLTGKAAGFAAEDRKLAESIARGRAWEKAKGTGEKLPDGWTPTEDEIQRVMPIAQRMNDKNNKIRQLIRSDAEWANFGYYKYAEPNEEDRRKGAEQARKEGLTGQAALQRADELAWKSVWGRDVEAWQEDTARKQEEQQRKQEAAELAESKQNLKELTDKGKRIDPNRSNLGTTGPKPAYDPKSIKVNDRDQVDPNGWQLVDSGASGLPVGSEYGRIYTTVYNYNPHSKWYGKRLLAVIEDDRTSTQYARLSNTNRRQMYRGSLYYYDEDLGRWNQVPAEEGERIQMPRTDMRQGKEAELASGESGEKVPVNGNNGRAIYNDLYGILMDKENTPGQRSAREVQAGFYRGDAVAASAFVDQMLYAKGPIGQDKIRYEMTGQTPVNKRGEYFYSEKEVVDAMTALIEDRTNQAEQIDGEMLRLERAGETWTDEYKQLKRTKEFIVAEIKHFESASVIFNPDYDEKSKYNEKYKSDPVYQWVNGKEITTAGGLAVTSPTGEEYNPMTRGDEPTAWQKLLGNSSLTEAEGDAAAYNKDVYPEEVKGKYNYIYETKGAEAAREYLRGLEMYSFYMTQEGKNQQTEQSTQDSPVWQNALSVLEMPRSAMGSMMYTMNRWRGMEQSPYDPLLSTTAHSQQVRKTTHDMIDATETVPLVKAACKFLYDAAMSSADSAYSAFLGSFMVPGVGSGAGAVAKTMQRIMTTVASVNLQAAPASSKLYADYVANGMAPEKAAALASASYIMEVGTEAAGMEWVFGQVAKAPTHKFLRAMACSFLAEGLEEVPGEVVTTVMDQIINGDDSEFMQSVEVFKKQYKSQNKGASEEEAERWAMAQAGLKWIGDVAREFAIAGLSASGSTTVRYAQGYFKTGGTSEAMINEKIEEMKAAGADVTGLNRGLLMQAAEDIRQAELTGGQVDMALQNKAQAEIARVMDPVITRGNQIIEDQIAREWAQIRPGQTTDGVQEDLQPVEDAAAAEAFDQGNPAETPAVPAMPAAPAMPAQLPGTRTLQEMQPVAAATERTTPEQAIAQGVTPAETPAETLADTHEQAPMTPEGMTQAAERAAETQDQQRVHELSGYIAGQQGELNEVQARKQRMKSNRDRLQATIDQTRAQAEATPEEGQPVQLQRGQAVSLNDLARRSGPTKAQLMDAVHRYEEQLHGIDDSLRQLTHDEQAIQANLNAAQEDLETVRGRIHSRDNRTAQQRQPVAAATDRTAPQAAPAAEDTQSARHGDDNPSQPSGINFSQQTPAEEQAENTRKARGAIQQRRAQVERELSEARDLLRSLEKSQRGGIFNRRNRSEQSRQMDEQATNATRARVNQLEQELNSLQANEERINTLLAQQEEAARLERERQHPSSATDRNSARETVPAAEQAAPDAAETTPARTNTNEETQTTPAVEETLPAAEETTPAAEETTPETEQPAEIPVDEQLQETEQPVTNDRELETPANQLTQPATPAIETTTPTTQDTTPTTAQETVTPQNTNRGGRRGGQTVVANLTDNSNRQTLQPLTESEFRALRLHELGQKTIHDQAKVEELQERLEAMTGRKATHASFEAGAKIGGKDVVVTGLVSTGQGATVELEEDGVQTTAPLSEIKFDNPALAETYQRASAYNSLTTARRYLAGWEMTTLDPITYGRAFSAIHEAARNEHNLAPEELTWASMLERKVKDIAANAGRAEAAENRALPLNETEQANLDKAAENYVRGIPTDEKYTGVAIDLQEGRQLRMKEKAWAEALNTLGRMSGTQIILTDRLSSRENGAFFGGNKMYVSIDAARSAPLLTAMHESWHYVKTWAGSSETLSKKVQALENKILEILQRDPDFDLNQRIKEKQQLYKKVKGQDLDPYAAKEEIVADSLRSVADRMQAVEFTAENMATDVSDVVKKLKERIGQWRNWIRRAVKRLGMANPEVRSMMQADEKTLNAIAEQFGALLQDVKAGREMGQLTARENAQEHRDSLRDQGIETKERFSLDEAVEYTEDLVAVHNLDERGLLADLQMGGFPMPSIAVVKRSEGWTDYGKISVVFDRYTVDPQLNPNAQLYAGDAFTPTMGAYQARDAQDALSHLRSQPARDIRQAGAKRAQRLYNINQAHRLQEAVEDTDFSDYIGEGINAIQALLRDQNPQLTGRITNEFGWTTTDNRLNEALNDTIVEMMDQLNREEADNLPENPMELLRSFNETMRQHLADKGATEFNGMDEEEENAAVLQEVFDGYRQDAQSWMQEAKPNEVVGFDHVKMVFLPSTASSQVRQALQDAGVPVSTYQDSDIMEERRRTRLAALNDFADAYHSQERDAGESVLFSVEDADNMDAVKRGDMDAAEEIVAQAAREQNAERHSLREPITYDSLVQKPDMSIQDISPKPANFNKTVARIEGFNNAIKEGRKVSDSKALVFVDDIGYEVEVTKEALKHNSFNEIRATKDGLAVMNVGTLLKNSIHINTYTQRDAGIPSTDVLMGVGRIGQNIIFATMNINNVTKQLGEVHLVYSARTAKQRANNNSQRRRTKLSDTTALFAYGSDKISVADALNLVKDSFNDVLPLNVLNRLGTQRKTTKDTQYLMYSLEDADYLDAVKRGDMDTAEEMVAQAAEQAMPDSKVRGKDGKLRKVYHGTNSEDFTVFDPGRQGSASGDIGFFGRGFYFAYSKGEAGYYGKRVMEAYLNIKKPFNFQEELGTYDGFRTNIINADRSAFVVNFANKFPELAAKEHVTVGSKQMTFRGYADLFEELYNGKTFNVEETEYEGEKAWLVSGDLVTEEYEYKGKKEKYQYYDYQKRYQTKKDAENKVNQITGYIESKYGHLQIPPAASVIMETDFSAALQARGYDGVIQSEEGDEAVIFDSSQAKLADPVTYDDKGDPIPLSQRFNEAEEDIRFSLSEEEENLHDTLLSVDEYNPEMFRLLRENEDLQRLTEELGAELQSWRGRDLDVTDPAKINKLARQLRDEYKTTIPLTDLKADLTEVMQGMARATTPEQMKAAMQAMSDLSLYIIEQSQDKDTSLSEEYQEERSYIKSLRLGKSGWSWAVDAFGDAQSARSALGFLLGRQSRDDINNGNVDSIYQELTAINPGSFPADITNPADQLRHMVEFYEATSPQYYNPFQETREGGYSERIPEAEARRAAAHMATEIFSSFVKSGNRGGKASARLSRIESLTDRMGQVFAINSTGESAVNEINRVEAKYKRQVADLRRQLEEQNQASRRALDEQKRVNQRALDEQAAAANADRARALGEQRQELQEASDARRAREAARRSENEERRKTVGEIVRKKNALLKKLEHPNSNGWVPTSMRQAVTDLLGAVDVNGEIIEGKRILTAETLQKALDSYKSINKQGNNGEERGPMASYYNGELENDFRHLIDNAAGKNMRQLTQEDLNALRNVVSGYAAAIINANRVFTDNRRATLTEMGTEYMAQLRDHMAKYGEEKVKGTLGTWFSDAVSRGLLKPVTVFHEYEGTELGRIYEEKLRPAEFKHIRNVEAAGEFLQQMCDKYSFLQKAINQDGQKKTDKNSHAFKVGDRTLRLTDLELMTLYAWQKREAAMGTNHLLGGGITLKNAAKGDTMGEYRLNELLLKQMTDTLTDEMKACADEMVHYLSTTVGEWGNEVTRELYGLEKFTESYYLPFKVNRNYVASNPAQAQDARIKTASFTKQLTDKASTTLELESFGSLWAAHVEQMSDFNAFTLPMEDITRLINFKTGAYDDEGNYIGQGDNVRPMMLRAFGKQSVDYINSFLTRLNGNSRGEHGGSWINTMMGKAKGAAVTFNLSVAMQQMGAGVRAMGEMNPADVLVGFIPGLKFWKEYPELEKWAPIAVEKGWGYFDTNMKNGLYDRQKSGWRQRADELGGKMAETGDKLNWSQIWVACKHETKRLHKDLTGDAFYQQAAKRFAEVIDRTQVVDSIFQRSEWATEKGMMKSLMAFMSEPVTQYNMLYRAASDLQKSIKAKDGTRAKSAGRLIRQASTIAASAALTTLLKSLVSGLRDRKREKKDEEGNIIGRRTYRERVMDSYGSNFLDNVFGLLTVFGNMWNDATSSYSSGGLDTQWIRYVVQTCKELEKGEKMNPYKVVYSSAQVVSQLTGVGVGGLVRDGWGLYSSAKEHFTQDTDYTAAYDKDKPFDTRIGALEKNFVYKKEYKTGDQKVNTGIYTDMMVEIFLAEGFSDNYQRVADLALQSGAAAKGLQTTFKTKLRAAEERIPAAARALDEGDMDTYTQLVQEMQEAGIGDKALFAMITSEYNDLQPEGESEGVTESGADVVSGLTEDEDAKDPAIEAYKKSYVEAVLSGDTERAGQLATRLEGSTDAPTMAAWVSSEASKRLTSAIKTDDAPTISNAITVAKRGGMDAGKIRDKMSTAYKKDWILACYHGDTAEQQRLRGLLLTDGSGIGQDDLNDWATSRAFSSDKEVGLYWMIKEGNTEDAKQTAQYLYRTYPGGQQAVKAKLEAWAKRLKAGEYDYQAVYSTMLAMGFSRATLDKILKK